MLIELFLKVLNLSIGAVPLMAVILLLRFIFKKIVPRKVFYFAWILVFVRLMIPFSVESDLSFFNFLPESYVSQSQNGPALEFVKDEGYTLDFPVLQHPSEDNPFVDAVAPEEEETTPTVAPEKPVTTPTVTKSPIEQNLIFATGWIFGTAGLLIFGIIGYIAVLHKIRFESVPFSENIRLCDFFTTPMVCGFVKPKIILPLTFDFDDKARVTSVLSHENTHIARLDNLKRLLATFTLYVHWFNPLVWICYWAFIRDMEVSCDEEVLRKAKDDIRGEYANSLITLARSGINPLYGGVLSFGETAIKERVKCIMNFKKAKLFIIIICCAVAVALGVIFLTNPTVPNAENSFIVTPENIGEISYHGKDGAAVNASITNTGAETLYLSPEHKLYYETETGFELCSTFYPGGNGVTVISPGEKISFCGIISANEFKTVPNISANYKIEREVFTDASCENILGFAFVDFSINSFGLNDYFNGFASTAAGSFPDKYNVTVDGIFGNEDTVKEAKSHFDGRNYSEITELYALYIPGDGYIAPAPLTREESLKILELLSQCELSYGRADNPTMAGAWYIGIEYSYGGTATFGFDGRFKYKTGPDESFYYLNCDNAYDVFDQIGEIIFAAIERANELSFEGKVINTAYYVPSEITEPTKAVIGTETDLNYFLSLITGVDYKDLIRFEAATSSAFEEKEQAIGHSEAEQILHHLKKCDPKIYVPEEEENVSTGGANSVYIRTQETTLWIYHDGLYLYCFEPGREAAVKFDGTSCDDDFFQIQLIIENLLRDIPAKEEPSPEENETENLSFFPKGKNFHISLFNNMDKYCVTPFAKYVDEIRDVFKYKNFTNYNDPSVTKEDLGRPMYPVDTLEFAGYDSGKKLSLDIYEKGFYLYGSAVDEKDNRAFVVEKELWSKLLVTLETAYYDRLESSAVPSWLGLIRHQNVTEVSVIGTDDPTVYTYTPFECELTDVANHLRNTFVADFVAKVDVDEYIPSSEKSVIVIIKFYTGTFYTVRYTSNQVAISSNDMSYVLIYDLASPGMDMNTLQYYASEIKEEEANPMTAKPVIYLYPEEETEVSVWLNFDGKLSYTYPNLGGGWKVTAKPDGTLVNQRDGTLHRYLFWEGRANYDWKIEKGFVVAGENTENFLVETLTKMGLNSYEIADFVTYWVPRMIDNKYNLISFSGSEYDEVAKLTVLPSPDSIIRIHMVWKSLDEPVDIEPQQIPINKRSGFTFVEWGGTEIE